MFHIDSVMKQLCSAGARAIFRHVEVTGEPPNCMPEYFMPAFIFDHLGDEVTMTLETSFAKLSLWNTDSRQRMGLPPIEKEHAAALLQLTQELGAPRVDLVLYEGIDRPKDKQDFLALVEFKRNWIDPRDRGKLLRILPHIDTCAHGVLCGSMRDVQRKWQEDFARKAGDRWYECAVQPMPHNINERWFFCAQLFDRGARKVAEAQPTAPELV